MSSWMIVAAPLLIAALALLLAFAGCDGGPGSGTEAPSEYRDQVLGTPSLISYWRLGEAPGATVAADSKDGNQGAYHGGVTLGVPSLLNPAANAEHETAAQFDGSSAYVSVPYKAALNPPRFTVEVLVQIDGGDDTDRTIVSSTHTDSAGNTFGYAVQVSAENRWEAVAGDGETAAFVTATVGQIGAAKVGGGPYYVAMTYDGTTLTLYVNPVDPPPNTSADQVGSVAVSVKPNTQNELRIGAGANNGPPNQFCNGVLDEIAIYDAALDYNTLQSHFAVATLGITL